VSLFYPRTDVAQLTSQTIQLTEGVVDGAALPAQVADLVFRLLPRNFLVANNWGGTLGLPIIGVKIFWGLATFMFGAPGPVYAVRALKR
jgi:hypothetical protein